LGQYQARVYVVNASESSLEALAQTLDHGEDEWLFSYPGYGKFATPIKILIQQNRAELNQIRKSLK
jgi:histidinol-phosphate/aromatic aminotransferase/cobyric acid decarboxylase-like protein